MQNANFYVFFSPLLSRLTTLAIRFRFPYQNHRNHQCGTQSNVKTYITSKNLHSNLLNWFEFRTNDVAYNRCTPHIAYICKMCCVQCAFQIPLVKIMEMLPRSIQYMICQLPAILFCRQFNAHYMVAMHMRAVKMTMTTTTAPTMQSSKFVDYENEMSFSFGANN